MVKSSAGSDYRCLATLEISLRLAYQITCVHGYWGCLYGFNSVTPGRWSCVIHQYVIFRHNLVIDVFSSFCEIVIRWIPQDLTMPIVIILYMRPADERWHYNVTWSLIGWAHWVFYFKITMHFFKLNIGRLHMASLGLSQSMHRDWDKMATIFQTTFSIAFSWMKIYKFRLRFHWHLFPRVQLTIFQHWYI